MESLGTFGKRGTVMNTKPSVSADFTIDDIHKIREYHYEITKNMTPRERMDFYNIGGRNFLKEIEKRKSQKTLNG